MGEDDLDALVSSVMASSVLPEIAHTHALTMFVGAQRLSTPGPSLLIAGQ